MSYVAFIGFDWPAVCSLVGGTNKRHFGRLSFLGRKLSLGLVEQSSDLPGQLRAVFVIPVAVHFLPDVRPWGGGRGDGGAVVSVAEALPLQDVLGVLPLQVAGQHGGVGHAAEERVRSPQHPALHLSTTN